jgi:hypothetical protein
MTTRDGGVDVVATTSRVSLQTLFLSVKRSFWKKINAKEYKTREKVRKIDVAKNPHASSRRHYFVLQRLSATFHHILLTPKSLK